ncbi:hypothetical protein GW571_00500 [Clavibacter capsici]|uniref:hypothetical protein n=1 Tax=Clavibacter capsici TaxID=1874630 RepID=UPI0014280061|nr:hypothetical protein [Clavibacter capsici]QIS40745.1 hypothetical protein GW571_00500 [Clavibacter capsici]
MQLFPLPEPIDGDWSCHFLVHGTRHVLDKDVVVGNNKFSATTERDLDKALAALSPEDELLVQHEPDNEFSEHALIVSTQKPALLGWIPDWFAAELQELSAFPSIRYFVSRVNGSDAGWHMRLVVRAEAAVSASDSLFAGSRWSLASASPAFAS